MARSTHNNGHGKERSQQKEAEGSRASRFGRWRSPLRKLTPLIFRLKINGLRMRFKEHGNLKGTKIERLRLQEHGDWTIEIKSER